jgi:hypothetical protein
LREAKLQEGYKESNGESRARTRIQPLVNNNFVIRGVDRRTMNKYDRADRSVILRHIKKLKEDFKLPHVTANTLRYSGMALEAFKVSETQKIPVKKFTHPDHWSKIADKFNVEPLPNNGYLHYLGIINNINSEIVEDLYGDKSEFIEEDFELIEESEIDIELIKRKKRVSSPSYRSLIMTAYHSCAITGEEFHGVLEACHIQPYINENSNHVQNGMLLRSDIHTLFDSGLITVDENYYVQVSPKVKSEYYHSLNGSLIHIPVNKKYQPSRIALRYNMSFFQRN